MPAWASEPRQQADGNAAPQGAAFSFVFAGRFGVRDVADIADLGDTADDTGRDGSLGSQ